MGRRSDGAIRRTPDRSHAAGRLGYGVIALVLAFAATGAVLVAAATVLSRSGDAIAEKTGIGRIWVGAVLMAAATSLPELATDVAAVRLGAVDLAAGDLFGSSMANMLILAITDLLPPARRVLRGAALDNALAACLAILLTAIAAVLVSLHDAHAVLGVAPGAILLLLVYVAGTRAVYRHGARAAARAAAAPARPDEPQAAPRATSLRRAAVQFAAASLAILASAPAFAWSAKGLADVTGLGSTVVGTLLVGLATSLPELVASIAAVRLGAFDLAVGNLFGSNAFNMAIFFAMDVADPTGSVFAALDPSHALSALLGIVLMSLGLAAIVYRAERRFALIEPDSLLMVVVYATGAWLLYARAGR